MNRWDKRRQIEREREPRGEITRIEALRDNMEADLQFLRGKLEGIQLAIRIFGHDEPLP